VLPTRRGRRIRLRGGFREAGLQRALQVAILGDCRGLARGGRWGRHGEVSSRLQQLEPRLLAWPGHRPGRRSERRPDGQRWSERRDRTLRSRRADGMCKGGEVRSLLRRRWSGVRVPAGSRYDRQWQAVRTDHDHGARHVRQGNDLRFDGQGRGVHAVLRARRRLSIRALRHGSSRVSLLLRPNEEPTFLAQCVPVDERGTGPNRRRPCESRRRSPDDAIAFRG
jgi:hypothetical protein